MANSNSYTQKRFEVLEPEEIEALRAEIAARGDSRVGEEFRVSKYAIARGALGMPIQRCTATVIRLGLNRSASRQ